MEETYVNSWSFWENELISKAEVFADQISS